MKKRNVIAVSYTHLDVYKRQVYHMLAYDSSKLYDGIIAERNRSLLVLLVAVILAALAAYLLHKFMYSPIEELLRLPLPQADANARHLGMDGLLGNVVSSTKNVLDQNTMLREQARDHCAMLTTQAIICLLYTSTQNPLSCPFR